MLASSAGEEQERLRAQLALAQTLAQGAQQAVEQKNKVMRERACACVHVRVHALAECEPTALVFCRVCFVAAISRGRGAQVVSFVSGRRDETNQGILRFTSSLFLSHFNSFFFFFPVAPHVLQPVGFTDVAAAAVAAFPSSTARTACLPACLQEYAALEEALAGARQEAARAREAAEQEAARAQQQLRDLARASEQHTEQLQQALR